MSFSILYPNGKPDSISRSIKGEFDLLGVTNLLSPNAYKYFTCDPDTIKYRLDLFNDIANIDPLQNIFNLLNKNMKTHHRYRVQ